MSEYNMPSPEDYIKSLENSNRITEKAIRAAIKELGLFDRASVLDVPCGIGNHVLWMAEENEKLNLTGVDLSMEHIDYARKQAIKKSCPAPVNYERGDINGLCYDDNSFDFIWCCDGLWPGPPETGCLCVQPYDILKEFIRITKSGGSIAILFWSSHKLLPGFPLLEAGLNNTLYANIPVTHDSEPDLHVMRTPMWLHKAGLKGIQTRTFVSDIQGPLTPQEKESLLMLFNMFWGSAEAEVPPKLWEEFKAMTDPKAEEFILNINGYAGFVTYTMFTGEVEK